MKRMRILALLLALALLLPAAGLAKVIRVDAAEYPVEADGWYDSMEEVAVYLTIYEELPQNYLTKKQAQKLGWDSREGNLWDVSYGSSIGGDRFGNYEGILPEKKGRSYTECDIDFDGGYRNGLRIVFSNDGLIYYTDDHYDSFDEIEVFFSEEKEAAAPVDLGAVDVKYGECYTDYLHVAAYLHAYGELPINYIVKDDAYSLGFSAKKDNMGEVAPEFAIGGDAFGNREGLLPKKKGRQYYECDVDMVNGKRGNCRIVYSNDGLIYYTQDKYKSFTALYEE